MPRAHPLLSPHRFPRSRWGLPSLLCLHPLRASTGPFDPSGTSRRAPRYPPSILTLAPEGRRWSFAGKSSPCTRWGAGALVEGSQIRMREAGLRSRGSPEKTRGTVLRVEGKDSIDRGGAFWDRGKGGDDRPLAVAGVDFSRNHGAASSDKPLRAARNSPSAAVVKSWPNSPSDREQNVP